MQRHGARRPHRPARLLPLAAAWALAAIAGLTLLAPSARAAGADARGAANAAMRAELGRRVFTGEIAVPARVDGQDFDLPAGAAACSNCHRTPQGGPPKRAGTDTYGPLLTGADLVSFRERRGGPPSRYDAAALCRVLRTGLDPATVQLPRAMPRYRVDDAVCASLWAFLSTR